MNIDMQRLWHQLEIDEGRKTKPYTCTAGKLTIGVGRNLQDVGLRQKEIDFLLQNDIEECYTELLRRWPWIEQLDAVRTEALLNMAFNMGLPTLAKFKKMFAALRAEQYSEAAKEALTSQWSKQVGARAQRIAHQIEFGKYKGELL